LKGEQKMGMSTIVFGLRTPDETWKKYSAVWIACKEAMLKIPEEVMDYFEGVSPDKEPTYVKVDIDKCCTEIDVGCGKGIDVDLSNLPVGVNKIRFINEW
jgi:hypothetical protein